MDCKHQFFQTYSNITKPDPKSPAKPGTIGGIHRELFGVKVTCALCGQVREVWEDGKTNITIPSHDTSNTKN